MSRLRQVVDYLDPDLVDKPSLRQNLLDLVREIDRVHLFHAETPHLLELRKRAIKVLKQIRLSETYFLEIVSTEESDSD